MILATESTETTSVDWNTVLNNFINWSITTGIKLFIGLVLLFISFKLTNFFTKKIYKNLHKRNADETLSRVCTQAARVFIKVVLLACFVGYIGVEAASISATVASIGVAIGLALQGSLSNIAGGMIIVLTRPFKIGDFIETNDESGTVEDIHMFYTVITTPDNKVVHVPNGTLANSVIINYSTKDLRRIDLIMSIAYDTDIEYAIKITNAVCKENELILDYPRPFIDINEYGSSSIDLKIRVWCKNEEYWNVRKDLMIELKKAYEENGITIPFNQLEVAIKNKE